MLQGHVQFDCPKLSFFSEAFVSALGFLKRNDHAFIGHGSRFFIHVFLVLINL